MTVLVGEVQQWRDGSWRTILTEHGTPVNDRRKTSYHNPGGGFSNPDLVNGLLFGFDGTRDGPVVFSHNGRIYDTSRDHTHWGPR